MMNVMTYHYSSLLTNPGSDEAEHESSDCQSQPETRSRHTSSEGRRVSFFQHELGNPATKTNFSSYIYCNESGASPSDTSRRLLEQSFFQSVLALIICRQGMLLPVPRAVILPESRQRGGNLHSSEANHDVVIEPPRYSRFRDESGGNERSNCCAESIEAMEEAQNFIGVGHVAHPGVPSGVNYTVAETCEDEEDDKKWEWWVKACDKVCDHMANGSDDCDSTAAETVVNPVI